MKRYLIAALALFAASCERAPSNVLQGYGEAEYIYIASQETGVLRELFVREGDRVDAGARVFKLEPDRLAYQAASASASRSALAEAVDAARADARLTQANYARGLELFNRGFYPRARLDSDRAARDGAQARLDQAVRQLRAAGAETGLAQTRLSDLDGAAPAAGTIERVFHRPGEVVPAGQPIAALLTPQNLKIRFFVPQAMLARVPPGASVNVSCDGCATGMTARVSRVATEPQFTPPVIYSLDQRDKLVFLVEARLDGDARISPGMPVDVRVP